MAVAGFLTILLCGTLSLLSGFRFSPHTISQNNNIINNYPVTAKKTFADNAYSGGPRDILPFVELFKPPLFSAHGLQAKEQFHKTLIPELLPPNSQKVSSEKESKADFVYKITDLDSAPIPIIQGKPHYPRNLVAERVEGKVFAILSVDEDGNVFDVEVEKADYLEFAESARTAIFTWKFLPGRKDGKEVKFRMRVPITFRLIINRNRSTAQANNSAPAKEYIRMPY